MKYKNGTITNRPNVPVSNPSDETLLEYGWKTYVNIQPEYNPETHRLERGEVTETPTEAIQGWDVIELTELEIMQRHVISNQDIRIEKLERKIERLTSENTLSMPDEPEIPYENGILVKAGQIIVEAGKRYMVVQPQFTTQENWRPSLGIPALWRELQPDIPEEDLCNETPEWNGANWSNYGVGYKVKANNAIWEAINTTHTWIEPALGGNGAISWTHVKDCN